MWNGHFTQIHQVIVSYGNNSDYNSKSCTMSDVCTFTGDLNTLYQQQQNNNKI